MQCEQEGRVVALESRRQTTVHFSPQLGQHPRHPEACFFDVLPSMEMGACWVSSSTAFTDNSNESGLSEQGEQFAFLFQNISLFSVSIVYSASETKPNSIG